MIRLLLILSLFSLEGRAVILLNGTAASVGKQLITIQAAYFYRGLQRFTDGDGDPLQLETGEALRKTVQKMAFEEMVYVEMKSLQLTDSVPRAEAEKVVRGRLPKGKEALWNRILTRFGKTDAGALAQLVKSFQVEKFVQKKAETLTPIITEAEAQKFYERDRSKVGSESFEMEKPALIAQMKKEKMQKGLEEWVKTLKQKYLVTNYLEG